MAGHLPRDPEQPSGGFFRTETGIRLLSALGLAAVALVFTYMGGVLFALLWLAAGVAGFLEWVTMAGVTRRIPMVIAAALGLTAYVLAQLTGWPALVLAAIVLAGGVLVVMFGTNRSDRVWAGLGYLAAAVVVVVPVSVRSDPLLGFAGIIWIFAVVWGTDIAAYFTGRAVGGPKLWPAVSPGKTWSGFFGGLVAGTLGGALAGLFAMMLGANLPLGLGTLTLLSALASLVGQLGDLAESALKRHFHAKDSSHLIPGHGGVLDRLDAFCAVCLLVGLIMIFPSALGYL